MKKGIALILTFIMAVITLVCGSLSVCAASTVEKVIAEDFSSASDCKFLAPGDTNADGKVSADDLVVVRQLLLSDMKDNSYTAVYKANGNSVKYSDVNGDGLVNVKDLVRQKKNSAKNFVFVDNGIMLLNGNSAFKGAFTSVLGTGTSYEISITYKSELPIKIKMADLGEEIVFEAKSSLSQVTKTFETPITIDNAENIDFQIIGVATIDKISVTRANMDNDLVDNW